MSHAVVALPPVSRAGLGDERLRRWLSRGAVSHCAPGAGMLQRVLAAIGAEDPPGALAAIRYLGQTERMPEGWLCAADPVHFETRMRDLVVRSFTDAVPDADEMRSIISTLQAALGDTNHFESIDGCGYLRPNAAMQTASVSARAADGAVPDEFTPAGKDAGAYELLQAEVQMVLHNHPVNERRLQLGLPTISTLWFWGGGVADSAATSALPDLFGGDALLRGFWMSRSAPNTDWPGDLDLCLQKAAGDLVIDLMAATSRDVGDFLLALRPLLRHGRISRLTLQFEDRLEVRLGRMDTWKVWRGLSPLLMESAVNE